MLKFLIEDDFITYKNLHPTGYENMIYAINSDINIAKSYYLNMSSIIFAPNPLINLLNMLDINPQDDIESIFYKIKSKAIHYANQIDIVTGVRNVKYVLDSVIVPNSREILIYKPTSLLEPAIEKIKTTNSIRLLYTEKSIIEFLHPTDYFPSNKILNIYTIDVVLLAMRYYLWAKERMVLGLNIGVEKFLYIEYIGLIEDFAMYTIFNNIPTYLEVNDYSINMDSPFSTIDIRNHLKRYYDFMSKELKRKAAKSIYEFLYSYFIPVDYNVRFIDVYKLPSDIIITKHNLWALLLSKLEYLIFMFKNIDNRISKDIRNDVKMMININLIRKLPAYLDEEIKDTIINKSEILINLLKG